MIGQWDEIVGNGEDVYGRNHEVGEQKTNSVEQISKWDESA